MFEISTKFQKHGIQFLGIESIERSNLFTLNLDGNLYRGHALISLILKRQK